MRFIPEEPRAGANESEKKIFQEIQSRCASEDWTLIHGIHIGQDPDVIEGEVDFYLLMPKLGIIAIEAKTAREVNYEDGEWYLDGNPAPRKQPLKQASSARRAMRRFLNQIGFAALEVPIARLVWFTNLRRHYFDPPTNGDFQVLASELAWIDDLTKPAEMLKGSIESLIEKHRDSPTIKYQPELFTAEIASEIADKVFGNFLVRETQRDAHAKRDSERIEATREQALYLENLAGNEIVFFQGSAGSGKTHLLTMAAEQKAAEGKRTLLTCWNELMGQELERLTSGNKGALLTRGSLNKLMLQLAGLDSNRDADEDDWYEKTLPNLAIEKLKQKPFLGRYSVIVIDEFQDLIGKPEVLKFIKALMKNADAAPATSIDQEANPIKKPSRPTELILAGDDNQRIFVNSSRSVSALEAAREAFGPMTVFTLTTNTRMNPNVQKQMQEKLAMKLSIKHHRIGLDASAGLDVRETMKEKQEQVLKDILDDLKSRYLDSEIVVLSPFGQKSLLGQIASAKTVTGVRVWLKMVMSLTTGDQKIRWYSIFKFKGLEAEAIVITDIGKDAKEFALQNGKSLQDLLYVGISRAKNHCVVVTTEKWESLLSS